MAQPVRKIHRPQKRGVGSTAQPHMPFIPTAFRSGKVAAAAILIIIALSACPPMNPIPKPKPPKPAPPPTLVAAPIFEHGHGRHLHGPGLIATTTPLSEEDANSIILQQLYWSGIKPYETNVELEHASVPGRRQTLTKQNGATKINVQVIPDSDKPLNLDAVDREKFVAFEFVSAADFADLGGPRQDSSIKALDLKELAHFLSANLDGTNEPVYLAVFYDPLHDPVAAELAGLGYDCELPDYEGDRLQCVDDYYQREAQAIAKWRDQDEAIQARSRELLLEQVKDFIQWLRQQGVIADETI